jgi:hypothetical protein
MVADQGTSHDKGRIHRVRILDASQPRGLSQVSGKRSLPWSSASIEENVTHHFTSAFEIDHVLLWCRMVAVAYFRPHPML